MISALAEQTRQNADRVTRRKATMTVRASRA